MEICGGRAGLAWEGEGQGTLEEGIGGCQLMKKISESSEAEESAHARPHTPEAASSVAGRSIKPRAGAGGRKGLARAGP